MATIRQPTETDALCGLARASASVINSVSSEHQAFLNAGGLGILVGDGKLPHPGREYIVEAHYQLKIWRSLFAAPDLQHVTNPGYNAIAAPYGFLVSDFISNSDYSL